MVHGLDWRILFINVFQFGGGVGGLCDGPTGALGGEIFRRDSLGASSIFFSFCIYINLFFYLLQGLLEREVLVEIYVFLFFLFLLLLRCIYSN